MGLLSWRLPTPESSTMEKPLKLSILLPSPMSAACVETRMETGRLTLSLPSNVLPRPTNKPPCPTEFRGPALPEVQTAAGQEPTTDLPEGSQAATEAGQDPHLQNPPGTSREVQADQALCRQTRRQALHLPDPHC